MRGNDVPFVISLLFYFFLLTVSWLLFWKRSDLYTRPATYFIVISIMGIVVLIQILALSNNHFGHYMILIFAEIVLLSISFNATQQLLYQTVMGRDPWGHWILSEMIIRTGHIPSFSEFPSPYTKIPDFHILIATYMLISGVSYKWASYLIVGIGTLLLVLFVIYSLARELFNEKTAFLAVLFVAVSDVVLYMTGRSIIPNTIAIGLTLLLLYLFIQYEKLVIPVKGKFLVIILLFGLIFTHTISYAFALIQLMILIFLDFFANDNRQLVQENLRWELMFFAIAIFVWAFVSGLYFKAGVERIWWFISGWNRGVQNYTEHLVVPFRYVLLGRLGMLVLFGISGIGILEVLTSKDKYNFKIIKLAVVSAFFIVTGLIAPFIPTFLGINERLWYYGEILGSVYSGYLIMITWHSKKFKLLKRSLLVCMVSILIWLMFVSSISNDDNPLIKGYTIRTGWYNSEIQTAKFVMMKSSRPIATDIDFQHFTVVKVGMLDENYERVPICNLKSFTEILRTNNCLVLIRINLIRDRYFVLGNGYSQRAYLPLGKETKRILARIIAFKNTIYTTGNTIAVI